MWANTRKEYTNSVINLCWSTNHIHLTRILFLFCFWVCAKESLHLRFSFFSFYFFKVLFIYFWDTHTQRQRHRQREKQSPCRKPDVGLDPRTPGSCPEPKADAQPLSHPSVPLPRFYTRCKISSLYSSCFAEPPLKHKGYWEGQGWYF